MWDFIALLFRIWNFGWCLIGNVAHHISQCRTRPSVVRSGASPRVHEGSADGGPSATSDVALERRVEMASALGHNQTFGCWRIRVDRLSAPLRSQNCSPDQNSDPERNSESDQWLPLHLGAHTPDGTIAVARAHLHGLAAPLTKTLHHIAYDGGQRVTDLLKCCSSRGGTAMSSNTANIFEFLFNGAEMPLYGSNVWSKFGGAVLKHGLFPFLKARKPLTETVQRTIGSENYGQ